jgi:hypothetical protein
MTFSDATITAFAEYSFTYPGGIESMLNSSWAMICFHVINSKC